MNAKREQVILSPQDDVADFTKEHYLFSPTAAHWLRFSKTDLAGFSQIGSRDSPDTPAILWNNMEQFGAAL